MSHDSLRDVLTRRAADTNVEVPSLHDFRRAFALAMLRNNTDIFTLAKLMGHEGITVLQRYLKQHIKIPKLLTVGQVRWIIPTY